MGTVANIGFACTDVHRFSDPIISMYSSGGRFEIGDCDGDHTILPLPLKVAVGFQMCESSIPAERNRVRICVRRNIFGLSWRVVDSAVCLEVFVRLDRSTERLQSSE